MFPAGSARHLIPAHPGGAAPDITRRSRKGLVPATEEPQLAVKCNLALRVTGLPAGAVCQQLPVDVCVAPRL